MENTMDKKDILKAAQNSGRRGNEFEMREDTSSSLISFAASLTIGTILFIIEFCVKGIVNMSLIIVAATAVGADMLYSGIVFRKAWKVILGIISLLFALIIFITYMVVK